MKLESDQVCVYDTTKFISYKIFTLLNINIGDNNENI